MLNRLLVKHRLRYPMDGSHRSRAAVLDRVYGEMVESIQDSNDRELRAFVPLLLQVLALGKMRPFGVFQFRTAWLARGDSEDRPIPPLTRLLLNCRGLVEAGVDGEGARYLGIQLWLVHNSLRDYLLKEPSDPCLSHWHDIMRKELENVRVR